MMDAEETATTKCLKILMFPWLAHGHIFPFLELAKRMLKRKNFHIYFCTTAVHFSSINDFIDKNSLHSSIELVQLNLQPCPELPPHYHTTKNLPSNLRLTLIKAFQMSESSFRNIIMSVKPDLVIYDVFQPWSAKHASSQGIPAVYYFIFSAARASFLYHHFVCPVGIFPFDELHLLDNEKECENKLFQFLYANVFHEDKKVHFVNFDLSCDLVLMKTSRSFEGKYIDYFSRIVAKKLAPIGPLISDPYEGVSDIIQWLDKKDKHSTLYISFGSESFLSKEDILEIARALELCEDVNFIWVIRFPVVEEKSATKIEEVLPFGFLERVKARGVVVEWAPQAHILGHPSTGGFVSHCGWSSINESVYNGVPIISMTPFNSIFSVDVRMAVGAGICVEIPRDENNVFKGEEIVNAMKMLIHGRKGHELREKARELSEKMRAEEEQALDEATNQLWQLCLNKNI